MSPADVVPSALRSHNCGSGVSKKECPLREEDIAGTPQRFTVVSGDNTKALAGPW